MQVYGNMEEMLGERRSIARKPHLCLRFVNRRHFYTKRHTGIFKQLGAHTAT